MGCEGGGLPCSFPRIWTAFFIFFFSYFVELYLPWRVGGAGAWYEAQCPGVILLGWPGGPTTSSISSLSSSSPVKTDTVVCLLLCKSIELVLGYLVRGVVLFQGFLQVDEVQGSMVTAEWPLGVLTYTSESTVSCSIQTVMRTSPLLVLLQVADTSGPWMAGGVVRLLQFLYTFPWAMLQNILYQYYLTFGLIKLGLCFRLLLESGALCLSFQF